jgi:hypothetical protein
MKVYVLINSCEGTAEGAYTFEGKKVKDKELLAEANTRRLKHIKVLEVKCASCTHTANYYNNIVAKASFDMSASELLNFTAVRDVLNTERKSIEERINTIYQKSAEEVIKEYLPMYRWEERELLGD